MKAVFWLGITICKYLVYVSSSQESLCSSHISLCFGLLCEFFGDFQVYYFGDKDFLKGLVKFMEIGNFEDLALFKIRIW